MNNPKVLFVGAARSCQGGVTSVLKEYERMSLWRDFGCNWLETQTNKSKCLKIYYALTAYVKSLFVVPRYDIVHFHTIPGMSMFVQLPVFLLAKLLHKKTILHIHVGNQLANTKTDKFSQWVMNMADVVVLLAKRWKDCVDTNICLKSATTYIYNPISIRETTVCHHKKYILYSAFFMPNKGYETVLRAFASISANFPDWQLVMAGTGPQTDLDKISSLISELGIEDSVILRGWLKGDEMQEALNSATAYCLASHEEGFPMSVLEAWASGIPVISTPVGGIPDVAVDGENILLFDFDNQEELSSQMKRLIADADLQNLLAERGRELAKREFAVDIIERKLRELYLSL